MTSDIEVVIPCLRQGFLERILESFAWQSQLPGLVTVVGNTISLTKSFNFPVRVLKFSSKYYAVGICPDSRLFKCDTSLRRNIGLYLAKLPHVLYWDDDQIAPVDTIESTTFHLRDMPYVFGHYRYVNDLTDLRTRPSSWGRAREEQGPNQWLSHLSAYGGCMAVSVDFLRSVGGFDMATLCQGHEDQSLAWRMSMKYGHGGAIFVHEPPSAFHLEERIPYDLEPNANVCKDRHDLDDSDSAVLRCHKCPAMAAKIFGEFVLEPFDLSLVDVSEIFS